MYVRNAVHWRRRKLERRGEDTAHYFLRSTRTKRELRTDGPISCLKKVVLSIVQYMAILHCYISHRRQADAAS